MLVPLQLTYDNRPLSACLGMSSQEDLDELSQTTAGFLGRSELDYYGRLTSPLRKKSYLLGRYAIKQAVGHLLAETDLTRIEVLPGVFMQPVLKCVCGARLEISLTHSHGVAFGMACEQGHPIGIDVELVRPDRNQNFNGCFTVQERGLADLMGIPTQAGALVIWTAKEALSKALKCGLTVPFEVLAVKAVEPGTGGGYLSEFVNFSQYRAHSWLVETYAFSMVLPKSTVATFSPPSQMVALLAEPSSA